MQSNIDSIKGLSEEPSAKPDAITEREEAELSAAKASALYKRRYFDHLESDVLRLQIEVDRLHPIEIEHGRLSYGRTIQIFLSCVSVVACVLGGALFSSYPRADHPVIFALAWVVTGLGMVLIIIQSLIPVLPMGKKVNRPK